jgi:hypothetical protein
VFKRSDRRKPNTKFIRNFRQLSDKSFVDDFDWTGYCKYESRLVLRSTEIKPLLQRFVCTTFAGSTKMVLARSPSNFLKKGFWQSLQQCMHVKKMYFCNLLFKYMKTVLIWSLYGLVVA